MKLVWEDAAKADREEIFAYVEQHNPAAADMLDALFLKRARHLVSCPYLGRTGRLAGTRELVVNPRYILVYSLSKHAVRILRVLHTARQWP